jgi:hypothetical protein
VIKIQSDIQGITEIKKDMGSMKRNVRNAIKEAINITAKTTAEEMPDAARKKYFAKKGPLKKATRVNKAGVNHLEAFIKAHSRPSSLYDFKVKPRKYVPGSAGLKTGYLANANKDMKALELILRPGAAKEKYKAFIVRFKSKHIALAQRIPGQMMKNNKKKQAIKTIYSLSYSKALEKGFFETVEPGVYERLQRNIDQQMAKHIGGLE